MTWRSSLFALLLVLALGDRVDAACTVSATGVSFGTYNVFTTTDDTSTGSVTYRCNSFTFVVQIELSTGSSGTYTTRTLKKGAENLNFNLYLDAALTSLWGDDSGSTNQYTRIFPPTNNSDVVVPIYGVIPALQDVSIGSYNDTIIATINF